MNTSETFKLAVQNHRSGRLAEAETLYRQILATHPNHAAAQGNLGGVLMAKGEFDAAAAACRRAIELNPSDPIAHNTLGCALIRLGRFDEAIATLRAAIGANPNQAEIHNNLAHALHVRGANDESIAAYRQALALRPDYADAHTNLASVLMEMGQDAEAMIAVRRALELQPDLPAAHWNLGQLLLRGGDLQRGWREAVWRRKMPTLAWSQNTRTQPEWDGSPLDGRRILLWQEGGLGDVIQMIRFLPQVIERGGRVAVQCHRSMHALFSAEHVAALREATAAHEVQCSLLDVPRVLGTTLDTIPKGAPYLNVPEDRIGKWKDRLGNSVTRKVGLVWANKADPLDRCPRPEEWSVLAKVLGIEWVSLQKPISAARADGPRSAPREVMPPAPPGLKLNDWTSELLDLADTAGLIASLDLVICVDTAVAHLAGAMGKPVWLTLRFVPDTRWLLGRSDSPWYPTMRLFRQPRRGDWTTPLREISAALAGV